LNLSDPSARSLLFPGALSITATLFASTAEPLASVGTAWTVAAGGKIAVGAQNDHAPDRCLPSAL
jgi:hypothetical protein